METEETGKKFDFEKFKNKGSTEDITVFADKLSKDVSGFEAGGAIAGVEGSVQGIESMRKALDELEDELLKRGAAPDKKYGEVQGMASYENLNDADLSTMYEKIQKHREMISDSEFDDAVKHADDTIRLIETEMMKRSTGTE